MDHLTKIQSLGQFARICVEVNLAKPLVPHVIVRGEKFKLEYKGLHSICFECGIYEQRSEFCPGAKRILQVTVSQVGGCNAGAI